MALAANLLATLFVLFVYMYFGSIGRMAFHKVKWDQPFGRPAEGYYASLAEGYLRGQLSMAHRPDPRLMALPHPYEFKTREGLEYLWDASYLNGRYYLYFTPLPTLLLYLPVRVATGMYPADQLAATLFAAWAFVMSLLFVRRALSLANRPLFIPFPVWILALGLASVTPFVLPYSRTYEVATFCGAALGATWAYALLRYIEKPTRARLLWTSVWLALSIAARPNVGVLLFVFAAAILMVTRKRSALAIAIIPLAIVGSALLIHNYARFRDPLEFGHRYQLTYMSMAERRVCGVRNFPEVMRLCHSSALYTFNPPILHHVFPHVDVRGSMLDPMVSFADVADQVAGIVPFAPFVAVGTFFAIVLALRRNGSDAGLRAAMLITLAGWLVLLGLSSCWFVSARYELDFWYLLCAGAIVCVEAGYAFLANAGVRMMPLRVLTIVVILCASLLGMMVGFRGTIGEFAKRNPEIQERFSPSTK